MIRLWIETKREKFLFFWMILNCTITASSSNEALSHNTKQCIVHRKRGNTKLAETRYRTNRIVGVEC